MELDSFSNLHDFELYFKINSSKSSSKKSKNKNSNISGAFERAAVSIDTIEPFDSSKFHNNYEEWFQILQNFPLLFYGFGSKIELLRDFSQFYLSDYGYVIEIDGFSSQNRLLQNSLTVICNLIKISKKNVNEINNTLKKLNTNLFIIIHTIDSECLNDEDSQNILIDFVKSSNIFLISSLDRTPFWSISFFSSMNFYSIPLNTNRFYSQEIGFSASSKSTVITDSIERYDIVLKTLTENARVVFLILAKYQLQGESGLSAHEWSDKAQSELCVRMRDSFSVQLNEFLDHKLIIQKKVNNDIYTIPLSKTQLEALVSRIENKD